MIIAETAAAVDLKKNPFRENDHALSLINGIVDREYRYLLGLREMYNRNSHLYIFDFPEFKEAALFPPDEGTNGYIYTWYYTDEKLHLVPAQSNPRLIREVTQILAENLRFEEFIGSVDATDRISDAELQDFFVRQVEACLNDDPSALPEFDDQGQQIAQDIISQMLKVVHDLIAENDAENDSDMILSIISTISVYFEPCFIEVLKERN